MNQVCDIKFIFTNVQVGKDVYGVDTFKREELEGMKYKFTKNCLKNANNTGFPGIPLELMKNLFQEHYDVLVADLGTADTPLCYLAAKLRKKPVIFWSGDWGWKGKLSERNLSSRLNKFILPRLDAMVVPGTSHKQHFISLGAPPDRVFIMPYACNFTVREKDYENKEKIIEKLHVANKRIILYTGRLVKQKGVEYLINAFSRLKKERDDVVLIIVGEGESRSELELLTQKLNIASGVYFAGFVENLDLPAYYLLCDVCVAPSITYIQGEVWGRMINQAMSAGKPIIATDAVGAAFDMIKDGVNGFVVPEKDDDALYKAIKKVISEPELARKMGEESKRIVEQGFTYEHMVEGFIKAVESVPQG